MGLCHSKITRNEFGGGGIEPNGYAIAEFEIRTLSWMDDQRKSRL